MKWKQKNKQIVTQNRRKMKKLKKLNETEEHINDNNKIN